MSLDAGQDLFDLKRLRDVINAAGFESPHLILDVIQRTDENDGNLAGFLFRL
jgi:hypothetical protein